MAHGLHESLVLVPHPLTCPGPVLLQGKKINQFSNHRYWSPASVEGPRLGVVTNRKEVRGCCACSLQYGRMTLGHLKGGGICWLSPTSPLLPLPPGRAGKEISGGVARGVRKDQGPARGCPRRLAPDQGRRLPPSRVPSTEAPAGAPRDAPRRAHRLIGGLHFPTDSAAALGLSPVSQRPPERMCGDAIQRAPNTDAQQTPYQDLITTSENLF